MIRAGAALIKFYLIYPSVAVRHSKKAAHLLRTGGPGQIMALVRTRIGAVKLELQRHRADREVQRLLKNLAKSARSNKDVLLPVLLAFADDLAVLDILHKAEDRIRLVTRHILKKYSLLDEEFYARSYLQGETSIHPADHYMQYGSPNGLRPNPYFDPRIYLEANPDLASLGMDPVIHYALFGWREGRSAGAKFEAENYLAENPEIAEADTSPFVHFLRSGKNGKQMFSANDPVDKISPTGALEQSRGTILVVSHDSELGGAQQVVQVLTKWLRTATRYDVRLITMRGGAFAHKFSDLAPTFDISAHPASKVIGRLQSFAGPEVKAIFINSVASGGFLEYWHDDTPVVSYIHELTNILRDNKPALDLIKKRSKTILAGSEAVRSALHLEFEVPLKQMQTVHAFIEAQNAKAPHDFEVKRIAKTRLGIDPDTFLVTACGVLHWRKSPDKFIDVAARVLSRSENAAQFIWIGGGPDLEHCEKLTREHGLENHVRFTGYEPDIMRYLLASDLFLLPSEEDPFPLVCLYAAMALNPVVCFEKAGGMPQFVNKGAGRAVPFGDVDAMSEALLDYLQNEDRRQQDGLKGRELVEADYTVANAGPAIFHHIREAAELRPHVSIVVPNYNYERFLAERLDSIASQTYQDFEVILLDDKSSDNSVHVLEAWEARRPGTRVVVSEENSGSPFVQWMRGMRLANSELIWVAEADDSCSTEFLETLLPCLDDRNVFLAYTKSIPIDKDGNELGDYEKLYLDRIAAGRWSRPYVVTDHEEANEGLGIGNCIPNASSVIFRSFEPEAEFEQTVTKMKMCGDWLFYLHAMRGGLVAYRHEPLNFHRRHGETVTSKTEGSPQYFREIADVRSYVSQNYRLKQNALAKIESFIGDDLDRFAIVEKAEREKILANIAYEAEKALPTVLFVVSDLSPGGGQMFMIRLANEWTRRGGRSVLLNVGQYADHANVKSIIDERVAVFDAGHLDVKFEDLLERFDVDVIHSAIWWADRYVQQNLPSGSNLPWVITMHGCYETLLDDPGIDVTFNGRIRGIIARADCWVHTADKNRRVFTAYGRPSNEQRIDNGVETVAGRHLSRERLGLRSSSALLLLASRAIKEKGWQEAVELTKRLNRAGHEVDLMLIGEGPAADKARTQNPNHVHFFGQVDNLKDFIATADIGLLPSTFGGESMPLVLLEMMAQAKPIIATDVGEIPSLIGEGKEAGGIVVPLKKGEVDIDGFVDAVTELLDVRLRTNTGMRAKKRFEARYTIDRMVDEYEQLYRDVIKRRGQ